MKPIKEVSFEKMYDVPASRVWEAWTTPSMLKQWWGPDNVIIPECDVDLRLGGKFYIVMEAGEGMGPYKGTRWPMKAEFTVVEPNKQLSYMAKAWTEGAEKETTIDQITEMMLQEHDGKTTLNLKATINKAGPGASMAVEGMQQGFNQQLDKLENFLGKK